MKNIKLAFIIFLLLLTLPRTAIGEDDEPRLYERVPDHLAYLYDTRNVDQEVVGRGALRQIHAEQRRWENGRKLRVCLYGGNPVVAHLLRNVAAEWNTYSGVDFDFGPSGSWYNCRSPSVGFPEIRVGFSARGYWSQVGNDSERYGSDRAPSMNFDSFNRVYNEPKYTVSNVLEKVHLYDKATILHEFGHALALLHEHQNPELQCYEQIKWSGKGNVYEFFAGHPNYWEEEDVDRNLGFVGQTDPDYVAGDPDPKSIMMYSLEPEIFIDPKSSDCVVPENYQLSKKDKEIVANIYPTSGIVASISDVDLGIAMIQSPPATIVRDTGSDFLERVAVDLESEDAAVRRNARARLSDLLSGTTDVAAASRIVSMSDSYRERLGIAVAIGNAAIPVRIDAEAQRALNTQLEGAKDSTLRSNLEQALSNIKVE